MSATAAVSTLVIRPTSRPTMSSSPFIDSSAQLLPPPSSSSPPTDSLPPPPRASPTPQQPPPSSPPTPHSASPPPLPPLATPQAASFQPLTSLLALFDVVLQLFFTLSTAVILHLRQRLAVLVAPIRSTYAGHLLSVLFHAAVPLPLSPETMYAPPFPLAGSNNPEDKELAANGHPVDAGLRVSLYRPIAVRRMRKHTVSSEAANSHPHAVVPLPLLLLSSALLCSAVPPLRQLVLDLDETLVHTTDVPIPVYDCRVDIQTRRLSRTFYILKRPYLDTFLLTLSPYYHLIIFTASIRRYADAVIDLIDPSSLIEQRFFRSSCVRDDKGQLVKDLSAVGKGRKRMVIVDNSPCAYSRNEENAVPISTWYDEQADSALRELIPLLLALRNLDDVRTVLGRRKMLMAELRGEQSREQRGLRGGR